MAKRTRETISSVMRRVRSRDTSPEMALRKALWARGIRYRLHVDRLPGKPDIVIPSKHVAVFVDGDFWHGNQWRRRGLKSLSDQFANSANSAYWIGKISSNVERDRRINAELADAGWRVVRCWESELREDVEACVKRVQAALSR